jgi:PAS domain S-box-containing protein
LVELHAATPSSTPAALRVLLVEDEAELAATLAETFGELAPEAGVEVATTLAGALDAVRAGEFDAILVDLGLPDSQGLDTFRALHSLVPGAAIVVVTGRTDAGLPARAAAEGAQDYLVKGSFSGEMLVQAVHSAVERQRLVLDLSRSREDLEARLEQQAAVAELGTAALAGSDLTALCARAVAVIAATLRVDGCALLEALPGGQMLVRAAQGCAHHHAGALHVDAGPGSQASYTLASRAPVVISDFALERRFRVHPLLRDQRIASGASVVVRGDEPWGVLDVHTRARRAFSANDLHFLAAVANVVASVASRHRVETALREAESRLSQVIARSPAVLYALTPGGSHEVTWMSDNSERILGYPPGRFRELPDLWYHRVHPEDLGKLPELAGAIARGEDVATAEYRFQHADGRWLRLTDTLSRVRAADGSPLEIVGACQNVTAERELEEQLRQAQKMEAVGQLAGGVAHDFNNLLTAIGGYSDLLLRRFADTEPARREVEEIRRASEQATALTRQLLAFSRRQVIQPRLLDVNDVVAHTERMLRQLIGENIRLVTALAPGALRVKVDPGQLEQVVVNLAVNARDAMVTGGQLTIASGRVAVGDPASRHPEARPGSWVVISVADTGEGMTPGVLSRIFEPFFTTKEKDKGTGLGLSTVYGIVRQSGGWIEVESEPGEGSTFTVLLPEDLAEVPPEVLPEVVADAPPAAQPADGADRASTS